MTDETQPPDGRPPTLSYHTPFVDRPPTSVLQVVVAAILTVVVGVGGVFAAILSAIAANSGWPLFVLGAVVLGLLGLAVFLLVRSPRRRGFAIGIFIGLGLSLLIEGVCWMQMV